MPIQVGVGSTAALHQCCWQRWLPQPSPLIAIISSRYFSNGGAIRSDEEHKLGIGSKNKWHALPTFFHTTDASALGREIVLSNKNMYFAKPTNVTAIKWVLQCIPQVPRSLVHKLFRLRKVRKYSCVEGDIIKSSGESGQFQRVKAKDLMNTGDRICIPVTVEEVTPKKKSSSCSEEVDFIRSLVLYKDPALLVVNKPHGMAVQGGIGIKKSLDVLAATCLRYQYPEPPRLVHRLDRESSGILILGRTQSSTTFLHSIFREKTSKTSMEERHSDRSVLCKKYWALVIGSPRRSSGFISAPLGKIVDGGSKYERIKVVDNPQEFQSRHAVTEYRVIESSLHGQPDTNCSKNRNSDTHGWRCLPLLEGNTSVFAQLRVHCAEVLGTPIVGDYKYGREAHRKRTTEALYNNGGSAGFVFDKKPFLHLHCKQMVLPNVHIVLCNSQMGSGYDPSEGSSILRLAAPLPPHMQSSWDVLRSSEAIGFST